MKTVLYGLSTIVFCLVMIGVAIIGVCIFLMMLSISLEFVTGFNLIETVIKPLFGH
jgi:hypothetical protein